MISFSRVVWNTAKNLFLGLKVRLQYVKMNFDFKDFFLKQCLIYISDWNEKAKQVEMLASPGLNQ